MWDLIKKFFGGSESSGNAKSRLQFVLVQDRTGLTNDEMSKFKEELVEVLAKYFVIDKSALEVNYKRENDSTCLFINSPVVVKRQDSASKKMGTKKQKSAAPEAATV